MALLSQKLILFYSCSKLDNQLDIGPSSVLSAQPLSAANRTWTFTCG